MAAWDLGVATAFLAICLGTDPILVGGTPAQKQRWLTRIAGEGLIVAYGVTEPEAGSNVASLKTTADAVVDAAGNVTGYRLNGAKQFITNGGVADLYTILAKTPDGPSFFVVEKGTPGLAVGKKEDKHGIRASNTTGVLLEDVVVPADHLIGGVEGQGLKQANAVFGYTRLMVGAFGLGGGQAAARARAGLRQDARPVRRAAGREGRLPAQAARRALDRPGGRPRLHGADRAADRPGRADLQVEGSIAKYWCTEAGNRAADAAIQALGGYGYAREYMVEKIAATCASPRSTRVPARSSRASSRMFRWKETVRGRAPSTRSWPRGSTVRTPRTGGAPGSRRRRSVTSRD